MGLRVWALYGEDLVVAKNERQRNAIVKDHFGECRGYSFEELSPGKILNLVNNNGEPETRISAARFAKEVGAGFFPSLK